MVHQDHDSSIVSRECGRRGSYAINVILQSHTTIDHCIGLEGKNEEIANKSLGAKSIAWLRITLT